MRQQRKSQKRTRAKVVTEEYFFEEHRPRVARVPPKLVAKTENQKKYIAAIQAFKLIFGLGCAGTGKAQPLDSKILTPSGWQTMGDMKVGSDVIGSDGLPKKVIGVFPQGEKEIFNVIFKDNRSVECCADHLWEVHFNEWKTSRILNTSEIKRLSEIKSYAGRLGINLVEPIQGNKTEFIIHPYLMGVILGDGSISKKGSVRISSADAELINKVESVLPQGMVINYLNKCDYSICKAIPRTISGNVVAEEIANRGMAGLVSNTKYIPKDYLSASIEQRWDLLRGLLDTDGTAGKGGQISFCTVSKQLSDGFVELVRSLGGICSVNTKNTFFTYKGIKKQGQLAYQHYVRLKHPKMAFYLSRKLNRVKEQNQYSDCLKLRITAVLPTRVAEAQCIKIESNDHLYVTNDYVLTHNTHIATSLAAEWLSSGKIDKFIITRPAVEAGESLGFLPGELEEKYAPYLAPVMQILNDYFGKSHVENLLKLGKIEAIPLGFMRGTTFKNCVVLLDEAQNVTKKQMKMFLTRIGEGCTVIVDGDAAQVDIPDSGLVDAVKRLQHIPAVKIIQFSRQDIVRDDIVAEIIEAYDQ